MSVRIHVGDCLERLRTLPEESVHCVVTSPPYWGLRDYGVAGAIGLEPTLQEHLETIVTVFREVRRVLRKDGTLWLNYGDSYSSGDRSTHRAGASDNKGRLVQNGLARPKTPSGLKPKDLVMMPARVALALQADGWWLRSEIVWHKPNPMPESVRDRPTSAHEKLYLLTKAARYFYDADAVRVTCSPNAHARRKDRERVPRKGSDTYDRRAGTWKEKRTVAEQAEMGANLRNAWTIPTHAYPGAHFATFPPKLVEPCTKAGTSEKGCCPECGTTIGLRTRVAPVKAASGATGMSDPSPDNAVPFLAHLTPPSVREILATQDFDPGELVETALELVSGIDVRHGGDVLLLALAIGCLCQGITTLKNGQAVDD